MLPDYGFLFLEGTIFGWKLHNIFIRINTSVFCSTSGRFYATLCFCSNKENNLEVLLPQGRGLHHIDQEDRASMVVLSGLPESLLRRYL